MSYSFSCVVKKNAELYNLVGRPNIFSSAELKLATDNFSSHNVIGEGGNGPVYKVRGSHKSSINL